MRGINSETVDLIYLDPLFNTGRGFPFPGGGKKRKMAFTDTWKWSDEHDHHRYMLGMDCPEAVAVVDTARLINSDSHGAYVVYMGVRLLEMRRILKPDGSIYFHCDPAMSHGVKMLMDAIFGIKNFRNELIWFYPHMSAARRHFPKKHDTLFFFTRVQSAYHTSPFYRGGAGEFAEFRVLYAGYVLQTEELMARIVRFVDENDADALMFFFSDHGMYTAAGGWNKHNKTAASRQYFIRDHYGIYASARAQGCEKYFDETPSSEFATPTMIARRIVKCLAGGKDPAPGGITYSLRIPGSETANEVEHIGKPTSYSGYLYE